MAIGSISSYLYSPMQAYLNPSSAMLSQFINGLADQKKSASQNYFNQPLFSNLGKISGDSSALQSKISEMAALNKYSSGVGKTASYSDSDVLSAEVAKGAPVSGYTKTDVNVSQLAAAQENTGAMIKADENAFGSEFSLSITDSKGAVSTISVSLTAEDDNKSVMQSITEAINASNIGVKASLVENKDEGTVGIKLSGVKTGEAEGGFTVDDSSAAGLGTVSQAAQNAIYSVNGADFTSQSNSQVKITDGVTADLNKTGQTQITYQSDTTAALNSAQSFIDSFNSLRESAADFPSLIRQLDDVARNYSRALGFSGIGRDSNGNLSITDKDKLSGAIADGSFAKNFQGINSFGNKATEIARNAYKTSYSAAVDANFKELLNSAQKPSSPSNWQYEASLSLMSGLLFNMRI